MSYTESTRRDGDEAVLAGQLPITAIVITKNEEGAIARCVEALSFADQIILIDSHSRDRTVAIAQSLGAEVVSFRWNGDYPKKKQWGLEHPSVRNNWVLMLDADEVVTPALALELHQLFRSGAQKNHAAFDIQLDYRFSGRILRHGHRVRKRALLDRRRARFPEVNDLEAPGITEVEGHYQPEIAGPVGVLRQRILHDDPDPLSSWVSRHNRYSDWEAYLAIHPHSRTLVRENRSRQGKLFDRAPLKPLAFFVYSYLIRGGFLDGRAGFDYAYALAFYYWMTGAKLRELRRSTCSD